MKKILFIITQSEFGGAQKFLANLVTGLDKNKYEILVCAGPEGDDKTGLLSFLERKGINTKHLKYLRRGVNPLFDFWGLIEIYRLIKKQRPDTLFLCSSKAGTIGALAGKLAKIPNIIYRIGGWTFNDPWPKWKKKLYFWIEKWSAEFKDIIITNSKSDQNQAIKLGIKPKGKILAIYNGIDVNNLKFLDEKQARKELFKKIQKTNYQIQNTKIIGTIANLYPAKGLKYLIRAAYLLINRGLNPNHEILNITFMVIGEGQERKKLEKLIKRYRLENNFFLPGAIPDAYKYLKAFDAFVLPSLKEGFPWTILEAMAAEIPIIAAKVGAITEIKPGILVEPEKPKQLVNAIERLLIDSEPRRNFASRAKNKIEKEFSLDKMIETIKKTL